MSKIEILAPVGSEEMLHAAVFSGADAVYRSIPLHPERIQNEAGEKVESTPHAMEKYTIPTPELPPMSLLRRKV